MCSVSKNSKKYPFLSVVTPSYNQCAYLERTIRSVLCQNYPNVQYVIIDGGSTDGSVEIIQKYADQLDFWCSKKDNGQSDAINKGLQMARGEWVAFQNSDDIYLPGAFESVASAVVENPDCAGIVYGNMLHIDENDCVMDVQLTMPAGIHGHFAQMQTHNQALFWRRSLLEQFGLLDAKMFFSFDFEFFARLLMNRVKVLHVDQYLGAFRHHSAAKTTVAVDRAFHDHDLIELRYGNWVERVIPQKLRTVFFQITKAVYCAMNRKTWYLIRRFTHQKHWIDELRRYYADWFRLLRDG